MNTPARFAAGLLLASLVCTLQFGDSASAATAKRHIYKGRVSQAVLNADRLLVKGRYQTAADFYRGALKRSPGDLNAAVGLGMALGKQSKLDAADEQFDKVLAKDPDNAGAHAGKAMVMLSRLNSSSTTIRNNRDAILKDAEEESQRALAADAQIPEARYTLGMVYKEQGRLNDAAREMNSAIRIDSRYADGYTGLGMVKLAQGNSVGAATNFRQAIRMNSGDWTAHYGLGQSLLNQGQIDAALKEFNTALYQFPNSWPVRLARGNAFARQGNTVAAVKEYQESIRIKAENPAAYLGIADIREARGDLEHSIAELRSSLELMPTNTEIRNRIGEQSMKVQKFDDAIKEFEAVLATSPSDSRAADGLGTAYYLKSQKEMTGGFFGSNDFENAEQLINKAVALNPNDMRLRLAQAKLRALTGEVVDVSTLGTPKNDGERISVAQAMLAQNQFAESSALMNTVILHAPDAKQTFAIADLALMMHDLDSAEAAYRKGANFPNSAERSRRGLAQSAKLREEARKSLTFANDLARKKMTGSAIDNYHTAVYNNPRVAASRLGLAKTLDSVSKPTPVQLREAAIQYRAYVGLSPTMPVKEQDKFLKKAEKLDAKAGKREAREVTQAP